MFCREWRVRNNFGIVSEVKKACYFKKAISGHVVCNRTEMQLVRPVHLVAGHGAETHLKKQTKVYFNHPTVGFEGIVGKYRILVLRVHNIWGHEGLIIFYRS